MGKILTPRDGFRKPTIEARVERLEAALSMMLGVQAVGYRAFAQAFGGAERPAAPGAEAASQRGEDQAGGPIGTQTEMFTETAEPDEPHPAV